MKNTPKPCIIESVLNLDIDGLATCVIPDLPNCQVLKCFAREAMRSQSDFTTILVLDDGRFRDYYGVGSLTYTGSGLFIYEVGGFHKQHGNDPALDVNGHRYKTYYDFLLDLLGSDVLGKLGLD
jgi:hypothetical protein